jgi:hypothetical protein
MSDHWRRDESPSEQGLDHGLGTPADDYRPERR